MHCYWNTDKKKYIKTEPVSKFGIKNFGIN